MGKPLCVGRGPHQRELHDGAGLCSPGRWPIKKRVLPQTPVLQNLKSLLKDFVTKQLKTEVFAKLACGRVDSCPFGQKLDELREQVYVLFEQASEEPRKRKSDRPSPLEFRLLDAFLKHTRDPEKGLADFSGGVRVGVGFKLP